MISVRIRNQDGSGERDTDSNFLPMLLDDDCAAGEPFQALDELPLDDAEPYQLIPGASLWNIDNNKSTSLIHLMQWYGTAFHK